MYDVSTLAQIVQRVVKYTLSLSWGVNVTINSREKGFDPEPHAAALRAAPSDLDS